MDDHDLAAEPEPGPQSLRSVVAPRDDDVGPAGGRRDHPPEVEDLRAFVPFGMVEEREVVHGDDRGNRRTQGHRVVRAVPDVGPYPARDARSRRLFPRQSGRPAVRRECMQLGVRCDLAPSARCRPGARRDGGRRRCARRLRVRPRCCRRRLRRAGRERPRRRAVRHRASLRIRREGPGVRPDMTVGRGVSS